MLPEQLLLDQLHGVAARGAFEAHVTVEVPDHAGRERFRALCRELGVKSVLIELPEGASRSQPMTASYHHGDLPAVTAEVAALARRLRADGFAVSRVKLEAVASNEGMPETDEEAGRLPAGNYFEFHVKITLPPGADLEPLRELCAAHAARLSANAFQVEADGRTQRFATLRRYGVGRTRAMAHFDALLDALTAAGYVLTNRLREYTIFDSNAALDAGWIDDPGGNLGAAD